MRYKYSTTHENQPEIEALARLSATVFNETKGLSALFLVDSGAMVSVIPFQIGNELGFVWNPPEARIRLTGGVGQIPAIPVKLRIHIESQEPIELLFAWAQSNAVKPIFGQFNFFVEFEVSFYRHEFEFEVKRRKLGKKPKRSGRK